MLFKLETPLSLPPVSSLPQCVHISIESVPFAKPQSTPPKTILRHKHNQTLAQNMVSSMNVINWDQLKPRILQDLANGKTQQQIREGLANDPDATYRVTIR